MHSDDKNLKMKKIMKNEEIRLTARCLSSKNCDWRMGFHNNMGLRPRNKASLKLMDFLRDVIDHKYD